MAEMSKSKRLAEQCMSTVKCMLLVPGVDMVEVSNHILALEAALEVAREALETVMNYPALRSYAGSKVASVADSALHLIKETQ